jgi:hypothetical protein
MYCNYTLEDAIKNMDRATVTEMQMRWLLATIRAAADSCNRQVTVEVYKIENLHMPTLVKEILEPSGFEVTETKNDIGQKSITIGW